MFCSIKKLKPIEIHGISDSNNMLTHRKFASYPQVFHKQFFLYDSISNITKLFQFYLKLLQLYYISYHPINPLN